MNTTNENITPVVEHLFPSIYCVPSAQSVMQAIRVGLGIGKHYSADCGQKDVVEDDRWGRLGELFEQSLGSLTEAIKCHRKSSGMIYPKEDWKPGDHKWLNEQAKKLGLRVSIGPYGDQCGWHSEAPWVTFDWTELYWKAQNERSELIKAGRHSASYSAN